MVAAFAGAACIDFVEPDLPDRGAPAIVEATIRLTDSGTAELDARLVPGLAEDGSKRVVQRDSVFALGRAIAPDTIQRDGTRRYVEAWAIPIQALAEPATFQAPRVAGLISSPPVIAWAGIRRTGPDTIAWIRGQDVFLTVEPGTGGLQPDPELQHWFLRFEGDEGAFNISADGPPPDTIQVPARWIPAGSEIAVRLTYTRSAVIRSEPGDYTGVITLDTRIHWTVRMLDAAAVGTR